MDSIHTTALNSSMTSSSADEALNIFYPKNEAKTKESEKPQISYEKAQERNSPFLKRMALGALVGWLLGVIVTLLGAFMFPQALMFSSLTTLLGAFSLGWVFPSFFLYSWRDKYLCVEEGRGPFFDSGKEAAHSWKSYVMGGCGSFVCFFGPEAQKQWNTGFKEETFSRINAITARHH
jgi:hypothetical protein